MLGYAIKIASMVFILNYTFMYYKTLILLIIYEDNEDFLTDPDGKHKSCTYGVITDDKILYLSL